MEPKVWGPFWGEFGWEVAQWAPYMNAACEVGDIVRCQPGHAQLYAVDGSIQQTHPRPMGSVPDMILPWSADQAAMPALHTLDGVPYMRGPKKPVPLRSDCKHDRKWVVLHCRSIPKCPGRNLPHKDWDLVVKTLNGLGIKPVIVGGPKDYLPVGDYKDDLRNGVMSDTIHAMRRALVVVGASSGPMHLAQAAEAPVLVWSGNSKKDKPRYEYVWNHHASPTTFVATTWTPKPSRIIKAILDALPD